MAPKTAFPPKATDFVEIGKAGGTHVFLSGDRFLLRAVKQSALAAAQAAGAEAMACDAGEPGQARDAFGAMREVGFFGSRKLIVLDYAEALLPKEKDKKKKESAKEKKPSPLLALLDEAIARPDPENLLLILFNELDRRTKFFSSLQKKKDSFHEIALPDNETIRSFIIACFGGIRPDARLVSYFLREQQKDLFFIENEAGKLRLWAESKGLATLSLEEAEPLLSSLSEEIIFRFMDHLLKGDKERAIGLFRELRVSEGDPKVFPIIILLLQRHFRVVLDGRVMLKRQQAADIPAMLRANNAFYLLGRYNEEPPYKKVFAQASNHTVVAALHDAAALELGMKGVYGVKMPDVGASIEQFMLKYF